MLLYFIETLFFEKCDPCFIVGVSINHNHTNTLSHHALFNLIKKLMTRARMLQAWLNANPNQVPILPRRMLLFNCCSKGKTNDLAFKVSD